MTKIKESAVLRGEHNGKTDISNPLVADSIISLPQLFANVNTADKRFLKYVPDGFLSEEQIKAKREAQRTDYENHGRYADLFENTVKLSIPEQTSAEYELLSHENEDLRKQVEALKSEMKLTKGHKVKPEAVKKLTNKILREYNSKVDKNEISTRLEQIFNYVASENVPVSYTITFTLKQKSSVRNLNQL